MARAKKEVEEKKEVIKEKIDETIIEEIQDSIPEPETEQEPIVLIPESQMEGKEKSEPELRKKLRFQKIGGGSLRGIPGYPIVKPGQIFEAFLDDISPRFLPSLKCLDAELMAEQVGKRLTPAPKETTWIAKQRKKGSTDWDVINSISGKPINEVALSEADANKLAVALNN